MLINLKVVCCALTESKTVATSCGLDRSTPGTSPGVLLPGVLWSLSLSDTCQLCWLLWLHRPLFVTVC